MDDEIFKQKYEKYKLRVKLWEKDFRKKYGRIPSKYDIRDASREIRDSYKMYYKLKTTFLEDTLNDVLSEDGFELEMSQTDACKNDDGKLSESVNGGPQLPLDITAIVNGVGNISNSSSGGSNNTFSNLQELATPNALSNVVNLHEQHVIKDFEPVEQLQSNAKAWGAGVSKKPEVSVTAERKTFKTNLNKKLFAATTFSKRNPRKSLARSNSVNVQLAGQSNFGAAQEQRELLPDLETILMQKAREQPTATAIVANPLLAGDKTKEAIKTHVDEGWLNRTATQNGMKMHKSTIGTQNSAEHLDALANNKKTSYGLRNIDISKIVPQIEPDAVCETASIAIIKETINNKIEPLKTTARRTLSAPAATIYNSDSDSVVSDSDGESEAHVYRHIVKRRRVLETVDSNVLKVAETSKEKSTSEVEATLNQNVINSPNDKNSDGQDFSADDDKDADYVLEERKTKRKQVKAKRVKTVKKQTVAKEKKPRVTKAKTAKPTRKMQTRVDEQTENMPAEEEPLNPEDLKFTMALESGDITSVPRVDMSVLEIADVVAQRYINGMSGMIPNARIAQPATYINEKRVEARKKLEEKIATGKLNENFVTINIQKKKFARGKKTINFSKYKKKQWRDKKRVAALSGPDMDMGGCDGGVLKCFSCGQVGHFAMNCKVKGDTLLPLTAQLEEDPSPFPTLEEAERMAAQSALAVHSRNIAKLPEASNSAMYRADEEVGESDADVDDDDDETDNGTTVDIETDDDVDDFDLDEATSAAASAIAGETVSPIKKYAGHKIPEDFLKKAGLDTHTQRAGETTAVTKHNDVGALYDLNADGTVQDVTPEVLEALHMFGHSNFRKGQDRAVMRILSGLSTLVTLSTGSGKSLCYQLPAYLYSRRKQSITLVISPLVSLMEDQVTGVPHFLRAQCLHTNQTPQQRLKIMQMIGAGEIDVLLVSPEAVVAGERSTGFGAVLRQLPPIAFACIDEAHCVSQWSHNFRPSYLMICKVLRKNLGVRTVLGLTATATLPTRISIINHLGIVDGERGVITDTPLPDNLSLSVSRDEHKDAALLQLLNSKRFDACQSIIIYCTRRDECERIAGYIRSTMQDRKDEPPTSAVEGAKKKRKRVNWQAEPYHAGMPASRRRTIQKSFMQNELRIVVATIAFGMGINKPDIRAVIHYNMPRNFESYVQEIGRAGRDGKVSHCHLFLDAKGGDQMELRRHIYANSIDRHVIRKLLQRIFVPCACAKLENKQKTATDLDLAKARVCPGHEIGFSIEKTVEALDIPEENISTLLCYMELDTRWGINILSSAYIKAKIISYGGPKYLKHAAKECPPLAMAIALQIKANTFKEDTNIIEFSVVDIAAAIGWNSGVVKYQLKNLEWVQVDGYPRRSPITVNFNVLGFRIKAPGDFSADEIDDALDTLYQRSVKQEQTQLIQLQYVFQGLSAVAYNSFEPCASENFSNSRSEQLKGIIRDYFRNDYPKDLKLETEPNTVPDDAIINDINAIINVYPENSFSGRSIARIFYGISSPNYPAVIWGRCKYWRAYSKVDFNRIVQLANAVIVGRRA